jgi:hypothetical protein
VTRGRAAASHCPAVIGFLTLIALLIGAAAAWDLYDA